MVMSLLGALPKKLTEAQLGSLISVLESRVDMKEADNANEVLSKVLGNRAK